MFFSRPRQSRRTRVANRPAGLGERLASRRMMAADTESPFVQSISLPAGRTYGTGQQLNFVLNFNERVRVDGSSGGLSFPVEVGYAMRSATYQGGSGTRSLTFRMSVTANDVDNDGVTLGRVNAISGKRDFGFTSILSSRIRDLQGNQTRDAIPTVNTRRILVDGTGPIVSGYNSFVTRGRQVSLRVNFDQPVYVTGRPTVPVTIGDATIGQAVDRELAYVRGSGTRTLTFAVTVPRVADLGPVSFRSAVGQVIYLPGSAELRDRLGNRATPVWGNYFDSTPLLRNGNRVIVIGSHYESLGTVSRDALNKVLTTERDTFYAGQGTQPCWSGFQMPDYVPAANAVDLYRVAYQSTIPEQGNRPTTAYGLVAIPHGASGSLPLLSYQHGTLPHTLSAPSQAFAYAPGSAFYDSCYETRLNVAQFAGQGYVVIAPDYFGIGKSIENDSYIVKQSEQQACLDMLSASQKLLQAKGLGTTDLFLAGWSQGGVVTVAFHEVLEARGVRITGVSTAAAPQNTEMVANRLLFNYRAGSNTSVRDAAWMNIVHILSAFSLGGYCGVPNAAEELFGRNYEAARKVYMRDYHSLEFRFDVNAQSVTVPVMVVDGITYSGVTSEFINPAYAANPNAYSQSAYQRLNRDTVAGRIGLSSDMKLYYGEQDEAFPVPVLRWLHEWQRDTFGKTNIEATEVSSASHRGTFLRAVQGQLAWFNSRRS